MIYEREYNVSDLEDGFEVVLKEDSDYVIFCSMRNGIYCDEIERPKNEEINAVKDAVLSLFQLTLSSLHSIDGEQMPAIALQSLFYYSASELFRHAVGMCVKQKNELSQTRNAFAFRIYFYVLQRFLEDFFYDGDRLEVVTINYDKEYD